MSTCKFNVKTFVSRSQNGLGSNILYLTSQTDFAFHLIFPPMHAKNCVMSNQK